MAPRDARGTRALPSYSIVVPICNEAMILRDAVTRMVEAFRQPGAAFEVVLCENGSTDRTRAIARELASSHPQVRLECLPAQNYGLALKHAIGVCAHDVVLLFNADFWSSQFVVQALSLLDDYDMVIGSKTMRGSRRTCWRFCRISRGVASWSRSRSACRCR